MDQFIVPQVKAPVNGEVEISGAKNAVLAVMAAALLADGVSEITNVPHLKVLLDCQRKNFVCRGVAQSG